tara:strand:+ start:2219 stop:2449 length:231 start_codon:yes stop_codon:yes gene_type:complete
MALPEELQNQVDYQTQIDNNRMANQNASDAKRAKLEALRMAKDIVMENHKTAAAGSVVGATDITAMATTLEAFVNS